MRTWEDGVLDTLEALNETDKQAHKRVAHAMLCPAVYLRAKKKGRLRSTGIARVARESQRDPRAVLIATSNRTRH
jgi:hypothetical protein